MFCAYHTECTEGLLDFLIISHFMVSCSHLIPERLLPTTNLFHPASFRSITVAMDEGAGCCTVCTGPSVHWPSPTRA